LTGTPAPNSPADLRVMFDLVWAGQGHALVHHPRRNRCFVRATKPMLHLPPMELAVERVPLSAAHRRLYEAAVGIAASAVRDPGVRADLTQIGRIVMLLLQAATNPAAVLDPNSPLRMRGERMGVDLDCLARSAAEEVTPAKFVRVRQVVNTNTAEGEKTLVWANFTHHIDELARLLADHEPAVVMGRCRAGIPGHRPTVPGSSLAFGATQSATYSWPRPSHSARGFHSTRPAPGKSMWTAPITPVSTSRLWTGPIGWAWLPTRGPGPRSSWRRGQSTSASRVG